jgi:hypothetical protein
MTSPGAEDGFALLDEPQPRRRGGGGRHLRWELALGLALLAIVAVGAGGDWWQGQARFANYRIGLRDAQQRHWDAARSAFLAAGAYSDAARQAAAAGERIRERDATYARAAAEEPGQWAAALRDWRAVEAIQPDFRDTARRITVAERQVYALALSGTVALRPAAHPPGLYRYTAQGWTWLQGSDLLSQARGSGSPCCVVYDAPASPSAAASTGAGPAPDPPAASGPGPRRLMVARDQDGKLTFAPLALDPAASDTLSWDGRGVLAAGYARLTSPAADPRLERVWTPFAGMRLVYQPFNSPAARPLDLPAAPWALLALTVNGPYGILADYSEAAGASPRTRLYLATFDGARRLLAVRPAVAQAAWLSPDNRDLLIDEFSPTPAGDEEHRLVVLPLTAAGGPVVAARIVAPRPTVAQVNWYSVTFIESGASAGKALIRGAPGVDPTVRLIDPADPARPVWAMDPGPGVSRVIPVPTGDGLVLTLTDWAGVQLSHYLVDAAGHWSPLPWGQASRQQLRGAWQRGDRLVYALAESGADRGSGYTIASQPPSAAGRAPGAGILLHTDDSRQDGASGGEGGRQWALGPGLLAHIRDGQLYAETYDGSVDLPLEAGVRVLYSPAP